MCPFLLVKLGLWHPLHSSVRALALISACPCTHQCVPVHSSVRALALISARRCQCETAFFTYDSIAAGAAPSDSTAAPNPLGILPVVHLPSHYHSARHSVHQSIHSNMLTYSGTKVLAHSYEHIKLLLRVCLRGLFDMMVLIHKIRGTMRNLGTRRAATHMGRGGKVGEVEIDKSKGAIFSNNIAHRTGSL